MANKALHLTAISLRSIANQLCGALLTFPISNRQPPGHLPIVDR